MDGSISMKSEPMKGADRKPGNILHELEDLQNRVTSLDDAIDALESALMPVSVARPSDSPLETDRGGEEASGIGSSLRALNERVERLRRSVLRLRDQLDL